MSELNLTHSNGNKVKLTTPDTLAADKTFKLPGADGSSGQFLKTDGSGALSFATPASTPGDTAPAFHAKLSSTQSAPSAARLRTIASAPVIGPFGSLNVSLVLINFRLVHLLKVD